jgi:hypothetical protein
MKGTNFTWSLLSLVVLLIIVFLITEIASAVGAARIIFFIFWPEWLRVPIGWILAFLLFDAMLGFVQTRFGITLRVIAMVICVIGSAIVPLYVLRVAATTIPNLVTSPLSLGAVIPGIMFYAGLPVLFGISMSRRLDKRRT